MNDSRNIAILAPANSIWIYEYIQNVVIPYGFDAVNLITGERDRYSNYYEKNNVKVHVYCDENGKFSSYMLKDIINKIGHCSFLHVQWAICSVRAFWPLAHISDKVLVTYWGSDLFDSDLFRKTVNIPMLIRADTIHLINAGMQRAFNRVYLNAFNKKIRSFDFGCSAYGFIDEVTSQRTIEECKRYFQIDEDKTVITIGYNSRKEQQHLAIIDQVGKLDEQIRSGLTLIIPWAYGDGGEDYFNSVKEALDGINTDYRIMEKYLEYDEISILRRATDIFLYAQTIDAQSASMMEFIYAGSVVVRPSWLKFDELDDLDLVWHVYDRIEEIRDIVNMLIANSVPNARRVCDINRERLGKYNSWSAMLPAWRKLYE